jgi:hypothetical protein
VEVRALSKTYFGVNATRMNVDFDKGAVFLGSDLQLELSRMVTTEGLTIRQQLTPLTSITVEAAKEQTRFDFTPLRDSNSTAGSVGIQFDPLALIKGRARIGYESFEPVQPGVPGFKGVTAAVDLSYVLLNATKFGVQATRDVQYSYDVNQPYYVQSGIAGSIMQQLFGPLDVVGRAGIQQLEYRDRAGAIVDVRDRIDDIHTYGAGVGYHVGPELRIGFNIDKTRRLSAVPIRQYEGLVFGTSVTYGF